MAGRKENLKSLFSNTRSRVIIIFTASLLIAAVIIGVVKLKSSSNTGPGSEAKVTNAPGIQSIPGALNPTVQYAKLQEAQNLNQAQSALKTGDSAIPTIIRTQALGSGAQPIIAPPGDKGGVGFATLAREDQSGAQRSLWLQALQNSSCSKASVAQVVSQGAKLSDLKSVCNCIQLKDDGYQIADLAQICSCNELKAAGFNARQLKDAGFSASRLRNCEFDACELRNAGFTAQQMKDGGYTDGELKGAGFLEDDIAKTSGLPSNLSASDVRKADCQVDALRRLRAAGVSAAAIRRINGCSTAQLKAAGYNAGDLRNAGFSAADVKNAGFGPFDLKSAGFTARDLLNAGFTPKELTTAGFTPGEISTAEAESPPGVNAAAIRSADCNVEALKKERLAGVSAKLIKQYAGCSAAAMNAAGFTAKELKDAGSTAAELKNVGFSAADLKSAGFSAKELGDTGFTAAELKNTGFNPNELKDAGFSAGELKNADFGITALRQAGYSAKDLAGAGYSAAQLKNAGYSDDEIMNAGLKVPGSQVAGLSAAKPGAAVPSDITPLPRIPGEPTGATTTQAANTQQLQDILKKQSRQLADQRFQQKIQQRMAQMLGTATQSLQSWQRVATQVYIAGTRPDKKETGPIVVGGNRTTQTTVINAGPMGIPHPMGQALIKTGDILFAVLDTSVNSDEPGPILATIVSGKLRGAKLIGSFNLPTNADKMVISFNTMSVPGAAKTTSISAYAIDPNTARTALSSKTDHHYLLRYGSLFASSFLEGIGNAFQSANTTVTIGGTGGGQNITVQNGIHRSILQNAVIAMSTLGKSWGQVAQQQFNTPTTVDVYSGTSLGILFTQDVTSL